MNASRFSTDVISLLSPRSQLPWTICVLFYGDHPQLCRRFLENIYRYTDPAAFHLRAGMNAVCKETDTLLHEASEQYGNITLFPSSRNLFKCPMMNRMFHDPPLGTQWTVWFDDDSYVTRPSWMLDLALAMEKSPEAELFGSLRAVHVSSHLEKFILSARWYCGVPRHILQNTECPLIVFPVGGFWAIRTARILETQWPDPRLKHFEDDYLMGEAMRQQGVRMAHYESGVCINDAPRRAPSNTPSVLDLVQDESSS